MDTNMFASPGYIFSRIDGNLSILVLFFKAHRGIKNIYLECHMGKDNTLLIARCV